MTKPDILLVDWLGRGGIAHTTVAWQRELLALGHHPLVMTRGGRELSELAPEVAAVSSSFGAVAGHVRLIGAIAREIRASRPAWIVLAGTVAPELEVTLVPVARASKTKICIVAHEASSPNRTPLKGPALRALWRSGDAVVCHSHFVGDAIQRLEPAAHLVYLALPKTSCLLDEMEGARPLLMPDDRLLSLTFGQLQKSYKGVDLVSQIAAQAGPEWRFALVGSGAPGNSARVERYPGFFSAGRLAATVATADVVLLPYRHASQSGAVVLAQEVGTPVVASAVGGIPEQIEHGVTGLLVAPDAAPSAWLSALDLLADPGERQRLARSALAHIEEQQRSFAASIRRVIND